METAGFDESQIIAMPSRNAAGESVVSPSVAVAACFAMALGYVLILYVPTFVLRLPPSTSLESFLIRRFTCALVFSAVSVLASATLLGIEIFRDFSSMLSVYGIRKDHMWQAAVYPLFLTSLLYAGSLVSKSMLMLHAWRVRGCNSCCEPGLCSIFAVAARNSLDRALACAHNVVAWRNYVVVMGRTRDAGPSAQWDIELTLKFCNLCILEIQKGNRPTTHFNKEGWSQLMVKFSEVTGRQYDKTQLKNRWDQLKKDWKLWRDLKHGATGLGWDSNKKTIMASDEWWNEKLQVFPAARKFRYNGICPELEEKLDMMFSNIVATGEFAWTPNSGVLPPEMVEGIGNSDSTDDRDIPTQGLNDCEPLTGSFTGVKRHSNPILKRKINKKAKMTASHRLSGKLDQLIDQTINLSTASSSSMCVQSSKADMATAVAMLDSIVDIDKNEELYGFAVDLIQLKEKRDLFIALENKKKLWFLQREHNKNEK